MKRIILWLLLIVLMCFGGWVIYLKFFTSLYYEYNNFDSDNLLVDPEKKMLSTWVSMEREKYKDSDVIENERYMVSLVFYEETLNVCVGSGFNCEELEYYSDSSDKIIINDGTLGFTGEFIKVNSDDDNFLKLMQIDQGGNKYIYYFEQPAG